MPENREDSLEKRRERLGESLKRFRKADGQKEKAEASAEASRKGMAEALKLSSEFISAIVVGAALGYVFDRFVGVSPWGMIFFLLIGFCAGVLNVLRATGMVANNLPEAGADDKDDSNRDGV